MRLTALSTLLAPAMLLAACASSTPGTGAQQPPVAAATTPTAYSFRCDSGQAIDVTYPDTDRAVVRYRGTTYAMRIAVSGSGSRYVGGGLEWWTKGAGAGAQGTLLRHNADGTSGDSLELCAGL